MKNVLVTGGSRGIGKEIVKECLYQDYRVHFTYSNDITSAKNFFEEMNSVNLTFSKCNLNDINEIINLFIELKAKFKVLDGLVNNAGISGGVNSIHNFSNKEIDEVFSVNVKGTIVCCREAIQMMSTKKGGRGGSIVNISSMASTIGGRKGKTLYAASKGAVDVFTIGAAKELALDNIRINAVRPGVIKTDMVENELNNNEDKERQYTKSIPFQRFGEPREVSETVCWLLSEKSSFISGARVDVSGGGFII